MGLPTQILSIPRPRNKTFVCLQGDTFYRKLRAEYKDSNGVMQAIDISDCTIEFDIAEELNPANEGAVLVEGTGGFVDDGEDGWFYVKADASDMEDISVSTDDEYRTVYHRVRFVAPSDDDSTIDEIRTVFYGEFHVLPQLDMDESA